MANNPNLGYRYGARSPVWLPVDSTSPAIEVGDFVTIDGGYVEAAAAGSTVYGVMMEQLDTAPSADGGAKVLVDVSEEAVYEVAVGTGTIAQSNLFQTCDVAAANTIDVTASADDNILIVGVDVTNNRALVQIRKTLTGVA